MDKKTKSKANILKSGKAINFKEEYGYDFVPNLNQWINIDEQKKIVERLENLDK